MRNLINYFYGYSYRKINKFKIYNLIKIKSPIDSAFYTFNIVLLQFLFILFIFYTIFEDYINNYQSVTIVLLVSALLLFRAITYFFLEKNDYYKKAISYYDEVNSKKKDLVCLILFYTLPLFVIATSTFVNYGIKS